MDKKTLTRRTIWLWHVVSYLLLMAAGVLVYHYSGSPYFQEALRWNGEALPPGAETMARILKLLQFAGAALVILLIGSFIGLAAVSRDREPHGVESWYTETHILGAVTSLMLLYLGFSEIRYGYLIREDLDVIAGAVLFTFAWLMLVRFLMCITLSILRGTFRSQMLLWQGIQAVADGLRNTNDKMKSGVRVVMLFWYQLANILFVSGAAAAFIWHRYIIMHVMLIILIAINIRYLIWTAERGRQHKEIFEQVNRMARGNLGTKIDSSGMSGDMKRMAEMINTLDDSLDLAVRERTRSERMRTDMIANVSHDLRTPLTSIISYVDLIRRENVPNPKVNEYLNVLEEKSMRLKSMAEALMEASRAVSGNLKLDMVEIDMVQMIHQVYGEFQDQMEERALTPVLSLVDPPALIRADGKILFRVLDNLFTNVIKYAKPGTQVLIELAETSHSLIFTMKNVSRTNLSLTADELTERFVRGDDSRSTEGSGLGLSIAKSMTERLGGRLDIFPDEELFRVRLVFPLAAPNIPISARG